MNRWRRFHYSASLAVIVTALGVYFGGLAGELILMPGLFLVSVLHLVLAVSTSGYELRPLLYGSAPIVTAVFYFAYIYLISFIRLGRG